MSDGSSSATCPSDDDSSSDATDPGFVVPHVSAVLAVGRLQRQALRLREERLAALGSASLPQADAAASSQQEGESLRMSFAHQQQRVGEGSLSPDDDDDGVVSDSDSEKTNPEFVLTPVFWKAVSKFKRLAVRVRERRAAAEQAGLIVEVSAEVVELGPELTFDHEPDVDDSEAEAMRETAAAEPEQEIGRAHS